MPDLELQRLKIDRDRGSSRGRRGKRGWVGKLIALGVLVALAWLFREPILAQYELWSLPVVRTTRVVERRAAAGAAAAQGTASNGYVVARTRAALSADTPGRIVEMLVEEGSVVQEGDLVARLYDDEYRAALARAEADLRFSEAAVQTARSQIESANSELERSRADLVASGADLDAAKASSKLAEANLKRYERLVQEGVETTLRLDEASQAYDSTFAQVRALEARRTSDEIAVVESERRVAVARALLAEAEAKVDVMASTRDQARATLDKTEVRAPFSGIVVLKDAEVGEVVSPNSQGGSSRGSVVTMVDFASLEVQADVPETSLSAVRIGAPARIYLDAFPNDPYPGRVERVWPTADRQTATVEVRVTFERRDERLRPEMGVRVVFLDEEPPPAGSDTSSDAGAQAVRLVDPDAVTERGGEVVVFVVKNRVVERRPVELGDTISGRRVVRSGLEPGEEVVLEPGPRLDAGSRVRVENE